MVTGQKRNLSIQTCGVATPVDPDSEGFAGLPNAKIIEKIAFRRAANYPFYPYESPALTAELPDPAVESIYCSCTRGVALIVVCAIGYSDSASSMR